MECESEAPAQAGNVVRCDDGAGTLPARVHMAPKARHAKGKARINAYQQLLTAKPDEIARDLEIFIPPGPRLGDAATRPHRITYRKLTR